MTNSIFAIVVTYNGIKWIDRCLRSLLSSSVTVEVLVIDNASTDNTVQHIKSCYPQVQLFCAGKNLGFGGGNNLGLKKALDNNARYCFLLNQDAWVETTTIESLVVAQEQQPAFGILSPVHLNGAGDDYDHDFYNYLLEAYDKSLLYQFLNGNELKGVVLEVPFVNAAAWLISRDCLVKTGGFDPLFFHYGEDDNYAGRATHNNFKTGILLSERMWHDRERPVASKPQNAGKKLHAELTQFLVYATDLKRRDITWFMLKRSARHFCLFLKHLVIMNREGRYFNSQMSKHILERVPAVLRSRKLYHKAPPALFLD